MLTVWSSGGGNESIPPELDPDPNQGYVDNSGGLVVLSADQIPAYQGYGELTANTSTH